MDYLGLLVLNIFELLAKHMQLLHNLLALENEALGLSV